MKDQFDDEAEKMIHELVKKLKYEYPGSVFNVSSHILEFDIGNTIPLAEFLRDKAIVDWLNTEYNLENMHDAQPDEYDLRESVLAAIKEEKK